ncbi:MAG TPA: hypothetical protein VGK29_18120 [Paludibaculum sp.]
MTKTNNTPETSAAQAQCCGTCGCGACSCGCPAGECRCQETECQCGCQASASTR